MQGKPGSTRDWQQMVGTRRAAWSRLSLTAGEGTTLLTPWFPTSSLQNSETTRFLCSSHSIHDSRFWAAPAKEYTCPAWFTCLRWLLGNREGERHKAGAKKKRHENYTLGRTLGAFTSI